MWRMQNYPGSTHPGLGSNSFPSFHSKMALWHCWENSGGDVQCWAQGKHPVPGGVLEPIL